MREKPKRKEKIKTKAQFSKHKANMQSYVKINQNQNRKETNNIQNETQDRTTLGKGMPVLQRAPDE